VPKHHNSQESDLVAHTFYPVFLEDPTMLFVTKQSSEVKKQKDAHNLVFSLPQLRSEGSACFLVLAVVVLLTTGGQHSQVTSQHSDFHGNADTLIALEDSDPMLLLGYVEEGLLVLVGLALAKVFLIPCMQNLQSKPNKKFEEPEGKRVGSARSQEKGACNTEQHTSSNSPSTDKTGLSSPSRSEAARIDEHHITIDKCAKRGDLAGAEQVFKQMKAEGLPRTINTCNFMLHAHAQAKDFTGAEQFVKNMIESSTRPDVITYNTLIDAFSKAGHVNGAESWLQRLVRSGVKPNVISYSTVIHACARVGDVHRAQAWLERMHASGIEANAIGYNSLIFACAKKGDVDCAERWLEQMLKANLPANVNTYTALIDCCAKANNLQKAEDWFERMLQMGVEGNVVSYCAIMNACARSGEVNKAEKWWHRMISAKVEPNVNSFSSLIDACAKSADAEKAEMWLSRMLEMGLKPELFSYSSTIDACGKAGDVQRAQRIFDQMVASGIRPNIVTYTSLARPWARLGNFNQVEQIQAQMLAGGVAPNEYFLNVLLSGYLHARPHQPLRAEAALRAALGKGVQPNEFVVTSLERCVGQERFAVLQKELGLMNPKARTQFSAAGKGPQFAAGSGDARKARTQGDVPWRADNRKNVGTSRRKA